MYGFFFCLSCDVFVLRIGFPCVAHSSTYHQTIYIISILIIPFVRLSKKVALPDFPALYSLPFERPSTSKGGLPWGSHRCMDVLEGEHKNWSNICYRWACAQHHELTRQLLHHFTFCCSMKVNTITTFVGVSSSLDRFAGTLVELLLEQPWPSGNALDPDQRGPWVEGPSQAIGDVRKGIQSWMLIPELKSS